MKKQLIGWFAASALTLFSGVFGAGTSRAGEIAIPNGSFESPATQFVDSRVDEWQKAPQPQGFDTNGFGSWDNLVGVFANAAATNADFIDNAAGNQLVYLFSYPQAGLSQDYNSSVGTNNPTHAFNAQFDVGTVYRLSAEFTSSKEEPLNPGATLQLSLYYRDAASNIITVASTIITYQTNVFTNITHLQEYQIVIPAVKAGDPWAGQKMGVALLSTVATNLIGGVWDIDNVRLTSEVAVPNYSFESPVTQFADPRIDSWQKVAAPATFDTNIFGAWDNLAGVFANSSATNVDYIENADGTQLAYLFGYPQMAIFQDNSSIDWSNAVPTHAFAPVFQAGKTYQLTLGVTSSREKPLTVGSTLEVSLYYRNASNAMVTVASTQITYDTNVFANLSRLVDFTLQTPVVRTSDPWAGQNIGIKIESTVAPQLIGGVWDVDNVRLSDSGATILQNPRFSGSQFSFSLQSAPGLSFEVLASSDLAAPAAQWTSLGVVQSSDGSGAFTEIATPAAHRFYRVRQVP